LKESNFQLIRKPKVNVFSFETNREFEFDEISLEINNNIHIIKGADELSKEATVILELGIFTLKNFEEVPFKINIEIEGNFKWDDVLKKDEELLETLLKQNAPAILYSYVRPLITLITVEANMPPLVIPLINFQK